MADGATSVRQAFEADAHIARMREDGYTIVENYMDADQLAAFRAGVEPLLGHYRGRNTFEGRTTERVYTLVARGKVYEEIAADPRLLAILSAFLKPNFLLSASHAICIYPGEVAQSLHTDDAFYLVPRPRPALAVSVIGAVDAFTAENGATRMIPGSHKWGADELAGGPRGPQGRQADPARDAGRRDRGLPGHLGARRRREPQQGAQARLHQPVLRALAPNAGKLLPRRPA